MTKIGYAAMMEQFTPTDLLDWCAQAEDAGFEAGFMVSEHFHPWTPEQGQSGFAWAFMGALGQRTSLRLPNACQGLDDLWRGPCGRRTVPPPPPTRSRKCSASARSADRADSRIRAPAAVADRRAPPARSRCRAASGGARRAARPRAAGRGRRPLPRRGAGGSGARTDAHGPRSGRRGRWPSRHLQGWLADQLLLTPDMAMPACRDERDVLDESSSLA